MAIGLDMFNLIIRIDALDRHYQGGFEQYKKDNEEFIEGDIPVIWFDEHLVRAGAMSAYDIEQVMELFEGYGLKSFEGSPDNPIWIDMCIVPTYGDIIGKCEWLELVDAKMVQFVGS